MKSYICANCNKEFKDYPSNRYGKIKCCSYKCKGEFQSKRYLGENNPCYRGGKPKCKCGNEMWYESKKCDTCSRKEDLRHFIHGLSHTRNYMKKYERLARARKLNAEGFHTEEEWIELKKTYRNICLCCKLQEPFIKLEEDHIIPLSQGGTDYIWNIQPLCRSCNSIKHTKTVDYRESVGL